MTATFLPSDCVTWPLVIVITVGGKAKRTKIMMPIPETNKRHGLAEIVDGEIIEEDRGSDSDEISEPAIGDDMSPDSEQGN